MTGAEIETIRPAGELVTSIIGDAEINQVWRVAKSLAASGMFKDAETADKAFAKILLGRDLGISPTQALMGLDLVEGNVQMRGVLLLSFVRRHPEYDYRVTEHTAEAATIVLRHIDPETGAWSECEPERFTIEDAQRAKLVKDHPKSAWRAFPGNMCLWRAASNAVKFHAPDLLGGIPVYTEADSFEDRSVGAGEGDGSEPGWQGLSMAQIGSVEAMLSKAAEVGHAGLSDRATVQMRLAGQTPAFVESWLKGAANTLAGMEPITEAEVVPEGGDVQ